MSQAVLSLLMLPLQLLTLCGLPYVLYRWLKRGRPATVAMPIGDDGDGGRSVPVVATFTGLRGLPWVALAYNNANPMLTITREGLCYRVLRRRTRRFGDIHYVDVRTFGATVTLSFAFRGSSFTLDVNVNSLVVAMSVLKLLPQEVAMSERAAALLRS